MELSALFLRPRRRLVQIYPTLLVLASKPVWVFQEFRSILRAKSVRFAEDSEGNESDCNGQARKTEPVAEAAVKAVTVVERNGHGQDVLRVFGQQRPDLAVAVDEGREARVDGARERHAVFNRPEDADGQVHVELGRAVEPAVVGQVDRAHRAGGPPAASSKKRLMTWGTVSSKQIVTARRYVLSGMSRGSRPKLRRGNRPP